GRRATDLVEAKGGIVPVGGKTGTTNDYRNAAFIGFVPGARGDEYAVEDGFFVGVYVGFDDNRAMVHGNLRVAGSNGALPAWIWIVQGIAEADLLGAPSRAASERYWPLAHDSGLTPFAVDTTAGLPAEGEGATVLAQPPRPVQIAD